MSGCSLVVPHSSTRLHQCWFMWQPLTCLVPSSYLKQCWLIANWNLSNKPDFNSHKCIILYSVVCQLSVGSFSWVCDAIYIESIVHNIFNNVEINAILGFWLWNFSYTIRIIFDIFLKTYQCHFHMEIMFNKYSYVLLFLQHLTFCILQKYFFEVQLLPFKNSWSG